MNKIRKVILRELRRIRQNPVYLVGSVGVMAFCLVFYLTFFRQGMPQDLPIGVVDLDRSATSREFSRQLDATQAGSVVPFTDFASGRDAMQRGDVHALVVLPADMERDVYSQRQPKLSYYINSAYYIGGVLAYRDVLTMIKLASGAAQREVLRMKGMGEDQIMGIIQPVVVDAHLVGNGGSDYGAYLNNIILPGLLQLCIIFVLVYAFGSELRYKTSKELMETAEGDFGAAVIGKLIPYTVLFVALGLLTIFLMFGVCKYPIYGSIWQLLAGLLALILANEALAVTFVGLLPTLKYSLSISALYTITAFSLSGFTFPLEAMPGAVQGIAHLFPLRYYYLYYVQTVIFGSGFGECWQYIAILLLFCAVPLLVARRLRSAYINQNYAL